MQKQYLMIYFLILRAFLVNVLIADLMKKQELEAVKLLLIISAGRGIFKNGLKRVRLKPHAYFLKSALTQRKLVVMKLRFFSAE